MTTQTEARALVESTGLEYKITDHGTWFEVETYKWDSLHYRKRSFEPDFAVDLEHYCSINTPAPQAGTTTIYNLTGVFGTMITVTVEHTDNNATAADVRILAVSDDAPEYFSDALSIDEEFIIARCFDGDARDGDQWALALDDDGQLTHESHAFNPQYVETFTINVKEHVA